MGRNFQALTLVLLMAIVSEGFFFDGGFFQGFLGAPPVSVYSGVSAQKKRSLRSGDGDTLEVNGTLEFEGNSTKEPEEIPSESVGAEKCFGELGCISITEDWFDILQRPINLLPMDRDRINTRFIFFNRRRNIDVHLTPIQVAVNRSSLIDAGFSPDKLVKMVVHGFIDTGFSSWAIRLAQTLTRHQDCNVLIVDWGGGSLPLYTQATANTRLVGLEIANLISFLNSEFGTPLKNVHIIGHSLGAQAAGYAGQKLGGEIGRITGLDPAEPYFRYMPPIVRLDPTDARFVDVIHTDGRTLLLLGYGMMEPCGHVDFYPNSGREQPGCELTKVPMNLISGGLEEAQRELFACSHNRAVQLFTESVKQQYNEHGNGCSFVAHMCSDYNAFARGDCYSCGPDGSLCTHMGIQADNYNIGNNSLVQFYLSTGNDPPFCVRHYRVSIQLAFPPHASSWVIGKVKVAIFGSLSSIQNIDLTPSDGKPIRIDHGSNLTFLVHSGDELGILDKVEIHWNYEHNIYDLTSVCWDYFCNKKLFVRRVHVRDIDQWGRGKSEIASQSVCTEDGTKYQGIRSGSSANLSRPC